ncbi:MAG: DUF523 domain-containing protein [Clostridiales bacterium]|nr:DUF523 domain-containing protein [Clostridiales bacterium]
MENIIVSACLLGVSCRYDGKSKPNEDVIALKYKYNIIPVCPEIMGGLPTPRVPSEISGERVINSEGRDVTEEYKKGAEETLRLVDMFGCKKAVLKEKSPSCGCGAVYDGTFTKKLIDGNGITSKLLAENGIEIFGEKNIDKL